MRILVMSDSHGDKYAVQKVIDRNLKARMIIHLGDGCEDISGAEMSSPNKVIHRVKGNGDFASKLPITGTDMVEGKTIFFTHGHYYNVKYGLYEGITAARDHKADIFLYGHTHVAQTYYEDGLYIMNPGSISHSMSGRCSYGIIDITSAGVVCNIIDILV